MSKRISPYELSDAGNWKSLDENNRLSNLPNKKEIEDKIRKLNENRFFIPTDRIVGSYALDNERKVIKFWELDTYFDKVLKE